MSEPTEESKYTFEHEKKARRVKRCNYCKASDHVTRNCKKYRAHYDGKKKPKRSARRGGGRRARGLSNADVDRMDGHITAQARGLALQRAQEELEDARGRQREMEAEVRVLERMVAKLS